MKRFGLKREADMRVNNLLPIIGRLLYIINLYITIKYNSTHVSPPRHTGARVGPRGSPTWPCVPRRTHVCILFFLNYFK